MTPSPLRKALEETEIELRQVREHLANQQRAAQGLLAQREEARAKAEELAAELAELRQKGRDDYVEFLYAQARMGAPWALDRLERVIGIAL